MVLHHLSLCTCQSLLRVPGRISLCSVARGNLLIMPGTSTSTYRPHSFTVLDLLAGTLYLHLLTIKAADEPMHAANLRYRLRMGD